MIDPAPPVLCCPKCRERFSLRDQPTAKPECPKCGPVRFPDPDAATHAYLAAAAAAIGAPALSAPDVASAVRQASPTKGMEVRDESGTPICRLHAANDDERRGARQTSSIDRHGIQSLLAQVPQAAFSALLLQQMSGHVVLSWTPEVATQLAGHAAKVMPAATGGFRAQAVDVVTHQVIGQAAFAPVSVATLGIAAGWQLLSLVVAQKHLCDINARLDQIERKVDELRDLFDADLVAEMRGDAEHLLTIVRAFRPSSDQPAPVGLEQTVDQIVRSARSRREKISDRLRRASETFTDDRGARYFGRTLGGAARALRDDVDKFTRNVIAQRLNTLVITAGIELLRQLGTDVGYTKELDVDVDRWIAEDDASFSDNMGPVQNAIMSVRGTFVRKNKTAAVARARLASRLWTGTRASASVRAELTRVRRTSAADPPRLLLTVGEGRTVEEVAWLDAGNTE